MEATENKIIASKLEELKTLPKDYQPNLDSKWELLEASLSGQDKGKLRVIFWMRAAAALIIFGLLGFWLQSKYKVNSIADTKTIDVLKSPPVGEPEALSKPQARIQFQNELNVAERLTVVKTPSKKTKSEKIIQHLNEPTSELAALPLTSVLEDSAISINEEPKQIANVLDMPIKKNKSRYVQLDFDDAIGETPLNTTEPSLLVKNIKISILKNHDTRSINPTSPHEALFKINF